MFKNLQNNIIKVFSGKTLMQRTMIVFAFILLIWLVMFLFKRVGIIEGYTAYNPDLVSYKKLITDSEAAIPALEDKVRIEGDELYKLDKLLQVVKVDYDLQPENSKYSDEYSRIKKEISEKEKIYLADKRKLESSKKALESNKNKYNQAVNWLKNIPIYKVASSSNQSVVKNGTKVFFDYGADMVIFKKYNIDGYPEGDPVPNISFDGILNRTVLSNDKIGGYANKLSNYKQPNNKAFWADIRLVPAEKK